jgi:uncharacterized protein (DUF302 family)
MTETIGEIDQFRMHGIESIPSPYPVGETLDRFEAAARAKGMRIFLRLDQRREAEKVGLTLRPTELLLFGSPKAGTQLMDAAPSAALDLPLKVLAWEDARGQVWLSYNSPDFLKQRHALTDEQVSLVAGIGNLLAEAVR